MLGRRQGESGGGQASLVGVIWNVHNLVGGCWHALKMEATLRPRWAGCPVYEQTRRISQSFGQRERSTGRNKKVF